MNKINICLIGGDMRYVRLCKELCSDGHNISAVGFGEMFLPDEAITLTDTKTAVSSSDYIILPMPALQKDGLINTPFSDEKIYADDILSCLDSSKTLLGGKLSADLTDRIRQTGARSFDYLQSENLAVQNAVPTAEGAIQTAMENTPFTIDKCRCLTVGYGRVGKALVKRLAALGADCTVAVRRSEVMRQIAKDGYSPVLSSDLEKIAAGFDIIFNTAEALVLDKDVLNRINPETLIIDLASKPGGVDFEYARQLGLKVIWALALPGKVAPYTAARIIKEAIYELINIAEE